jgi:hypothetical protein
MRENSTSFEDVKSYYSEFANNERSALGKI